MDTESLNRKFRVVDALLSSLDSRSAKMNDAMKDLQVSLEFSQHEIDTVKAENVVLKKRLEEMETEKTDQHTK